MIETQLLFFKEKKKKQILSFSLCLSLLACVFEVHLMARFEPNDLYKEDFIMPTHILSFYRKEYTI